MMPNARSEGRERGALSHRAGDKPPAERPAWEVGATVAHARFGEGIIKSVSGAGADAKVTVKFESGDKTLLAKFVTRVS